MNKSLEIPKFANEDEEREFWSTHSFTDYIDPKSWKRGSPKVASNHVGRLNFSVSPEMEREVEQLSRERKVDVQELIRQLLAAGLQQQRVQPGA